LGYSQDLSVVIKKPGVDGKTMYLTLSMKCHDLFKLAERYTTDKCIYSYDDEAVYLWMSGNAPLYVEKGRIFDNAVDLRKLSEEFECVVKVDYEGEDRMDCETLTFDCGKVVEHKVLGWVDAI